MQRIRNPFVRPRLVAFLSLWLALVISRSAHAGTYTVTYSGGQVVVTDTSGNATTTPYDLNGNNWGGRYRLLAACKRQGLMPEPDHRDLHLAGRYTR